MGDYVRYRPYLVMAISFPSVRRRTVHALLQRYGIDFQRSESVNI